MIERTPFAATFLLACGAVGLGFDAIIMRSAEALRLPSLITKPGGSALITTPTRSTDTTVATAIEPAAARDKFLRALMQPDPQSAVTIQRVDLPASPSASPGSAPSAPIALTLEGEYRAVKGRLLDWTAPVHALRLQEFTLTRGPEGSGRVVADVVLAAPATAGTP